MILQLRNMENHVRKNPADALECDQKIRKCSETYNKVSNHSFFRNNFLEFSTISFNLQLRRELDTAKNAAYLHRGGRVDYQNASVDDLQVGIILLIIHEQLIDPSDFFSRVLLMLKEQDFWKELLVSTKFQIVLIILCVLPMNLNR